jgi:hypothetical protein
VALRVAQRQLNTLHGSFDQQPVEARLPSGIAVFSWIRVLQRRRVDAIIDHSHASQRPSNVLCMGTSEEPSMISLVA